MVDKLLELEQIVGRSPAVCFLRRVAEGWPVDFVSDNVAQFGYAPVDFLSGRVGYESIVHPDDRDRIKVEIHQHFADRESEYLHEYRILARSGDVRWVEDRTWVRRDEAGAITHYQGLILDVTARKRAEEELQRHREQLETIVAERTRAFFESEQKYRTVLEHSHDGIFMATDGIIVVCNQAFAEMLGARPEEVQGHALSEFVAPEDRDLVMSRHRQRLAGEEVPEAYEFRALRRDAQTRVMHMSVGRATYLGSQAVIGSVRDITEQRQQEAALRASSERLREITQTIPGVIYQFFARPDGTRGVNFVSDRSLEVFGVPNDLTDFFPRMLERIVPEDRERFLASIDEAVRNVSPWSYEGRVTRPDGQVVWVRGESRPVIHGEEIVFSGLFEDVTERVRVEQALRESESKYRSVIENIQDVFYRTDTEGRLVMASPSLARLLEYDSLEDCIGKNVAQTFYADPEERGGLLRALRRRGFVHDYEVTVRKRDGGALVVSTSSRLWLDEHGRMLGIEGIFRDVTESKRVKEALRESKERLQQFLCGSPIPCFVIGPDHVVVLWNDALARLTGIGAEQMVGTRDHWRAFYGASRPCLADFLMAADIPSIEGWYGSKVTRSSLLNAAYEGEDFFPELGKEGRWLHFTAAAIRDGSGTLLGAIETIEDITGRRRAEEQLRHAQRMESVGRLAAGIAHDFGNLLTPILGLSAFLLEGLPPSDGRHGQAAEILHAAERARNLTRQLLAFSSKQLLNLQPIDLRDIVEGIRKLLRRTLRENIELSLQLAPDPCTVVADAGQIEQVLLNLAVNAQDAMPRGGAVTMVVRPVAVEEAGDGPQGGHSASRCVELVVSDTGVGMDEATREHAFEPFFTTKGQGRGTGLGLATVHGIVTQHGGEISLETSPEGGTVFRILLPACYKTPDKVRSEHPLARSPDESIATIMVVEDNAAVLSFAVSALEGAGYRVLSASCAQRCLEYLDRYSGPLDLLVTDVVMPNVDGKELADLVQSRFPGVAVLFISGYPQDVISQHDITEKNINLLRKPFTLAELFWGVSATLDRRRG